MIRLSKGANGPLDRTRVRATLRSRGSVNPGRYALALLPSGGPDPICLPLQGDVTPYVDASDGHPLDVPVVLDGLSSATTKLYVVLYAARGASSLRDLAPVSITIDDFEIAVPDEDLLCSALVVAEIYRRDGRWKLRAKVEGVVDGLEVLGRRLGMEVVDRSPPVIGRRDTSPPPRPQPRPSDDDRETRDDVDFWTGTGFLVARGLLVTNAHVVDGAGRITVSSFDGRGAAQPVIVDHRNDLALVRIQPEPTAPPLLFRARGGPSLGETINVVGYPLAGLLGSGPQVATGVISGLLGPGDDARIVQLTAPIQPGSSGGPVLDASGLLVGVVTSSLRAAQNVNFAVRAHLAATLIEAAGFEPSLGEHGHTPSLSEMMRAARGCVLRLECAR